ncbi:hypothetical protein BH11BAC3_BH11BAC3_46060 [soil metagenome]
MSPNKHISFNYKQIGVFIFLFLNCFLMAVPFIKATAENSNYAKTAGLLSQHCPVQDTEDDSRSNYPEEQQQYHITLRNKQSVAKASIITRLNTALRNRNLDSALHYTFAGSVNPERPAYYAFLSLYKLF